MSDENSSFPGNFSFSTTARAELADEVARMLHLPEGFLSALVVSFLLILVSEFCDKSFMITAYQAMQHSRCLVFSASLAALEAMTLVSVLLGNFINKLVPRDYVFYGSLCLFALFSLRMLHQAYYMSSGVQYEMASLPEPANRSTVCSRVASCLGLFFKVFSLIFLAEWGDRSQISVVLLAARKNLFGTVVGKVQFKGG